ncbi:hypothetical protein N7532_002717 [Penicillium argentinense]|uniref:Uncharacterized protein n=1 Tax=Penicillium argentinense TaxID=1131581 RepID=A0A9W9KLS4_9EURO|nr:uncharacterized protein N7532_002717 [Penicillium argentinense]KAJ5110072.1 hypothetical protein N7532_002717 [Penicillium argentinense]
MEYHAVPPEERARDENGNMLPWGYIYKDESRNPRRPVEEHGPFGKRRNTRWDNARSRTRTGTPAKRENPSVAEFGQLFAKQQEEEKVPGIPKSTSSSSLDNSRKQVDNGAATECVLRGYRSKEMEWKVIDKYERISQGMICEDYPRSDPNASQYGQLFSGDVVIRKNLSAEANRKSKRYDGGFHWIKVTFDSPSAADRAMFYSPQEIDGCLVACELYVNHGAVEDVPIFKDSVESQRLHSKANRTLTTAHSTAFLSSRENSSRGVATLPRSFAMNNLAATVDGTPEEEEPSLNESTTTTATSGTATAPLTTNMGASSSFATSTSTSSLNKRKSIGGDEPQPESEYMTHIPTVKRVKLRPFTEALAPSPTLFERILRSIPILSWFTGDIVGEGPMIREDGTFDNDRSNMYWRFWYMIDMILGTDMCGLKEES